MREIIFRGKSNHEVICSTTKTYEKNAWVCGCLSIYKDNVFIQDDEGLTIEVFPATVGQFTGLLDKNNKKIFDGDIVTAWSQGLQAVGRVQRRVDGLWLLYPAHQKGKLWGMCPNQKGETTVEVIGNIHDNPELVK